MQGDDGAAAVGRVLPAGEQPVLLELPGELARRRQRQPERARHLADRPLAFRPDVRQDGDVAARERRVARDELQQLRRRPAPRPQAAHDAAQQLPQLVPISYHPITIILRSGKEVSVPMCGGHRHRRGRGFPSREQLNERLQAYREYLEGELRNVQELIERLGDAPAPEQTA